MRRRLILVAVFAGVLALIATIWVSRLDINNYRQLIQSQMEQHLNRTVVLGNIRLKLIPLHFHFDNPVIGEDPAFATGSPFLTAKSMDVSPSLLSLLQKDLKIRAIHFEQPDVHLIRNDSGVWNFSTLGSRVMPENLILRDGQVVVANVNGRQDRTSFDHATLRLRDFAPGRPFRIDAVAHIAGKQAGEIRLRTTVKTDKSTISADGDVSLNDFSVNGVALGYPIKAEYHVTADSESGVVQISDTTVDLGSVPVRLSGEVNRRASPAELNLQTDFNGAAEPVTTLAAALWLSSLNGTNVSGDSAGDLRIGGTLDHPVLNGTVSVRNLTLSSKEMPQPVRVSPVDLSFMPSDIRSNPFEVREGNTMATVSFAVKQYTAKTPVVEFALRSDNATLPDLRGLARVSGMKGLSRIDGSGTLNLDLRGSGPLQSTHSSKILSLLNGSAAVNLTNLHFTGVNISGALGSSGKIPPVEIQHVTGHFALQKGIAQSNDILAKLNIGSVAAAGAIDLVHSTLNLRATAVLSDAGSKQMLGTGIEGLLKAALTNGRGELVIPGIITGTFDNPKFEPDKEQFALSTLKGILPTSDNPTGLLGTLLGEENNTSSKRPTHRKGQMQGPTHEIQRILGGVLGHK